MFITGISSSINMEIIRDVLFDGPPPWDQLPLYSVDKGDQLFLFSNGVVRQEPVPANGRFLVPLVEDFDETLAQIEFKKIPSMSQVILIKQGSLGGAFGIIFSSIWVT